MPGPRAAATPVRPGWFLPTLVAVALGGAAGSCLRAGLGDLLPAAAGSFPWTTLGINVSGCAVLALLPALDVVRRHALLPPMLGTGVLGGYTTLSAWSAETHALVSAGRPALATTYAVLTVAACLGAVALVEHVCATSRERAEFEAEEGDL